MRVLISCETGGEAVPAQFVAKQPCSRQTSKTTATGKRVLLPGQLPAALRCDASAKYVVERMAKQLHAPLISNRYSRDLIDVTRSPSHPQLFSSLTRNWPGEDRRRLIDSIYLPYRERLRSELKKVLVRSCYVVHLSVGTFELRNQTGKFQRADIGLLYDPAVDDEVDLCLDWYNKMYDDLPMLRVRRNYPRRGTTNSITKTMRGEFSAKYLGVEVLFNRAWAARPVAIRDEAIDGICGALTAIRDVRHSEAA